MIKPNEYRKNKHLIDFPDIKDAVITNCIPKMSRRLKTKKSRFYEDESQTMLKDY